MSKKIHKRLHLMLRAYAVAMLFIIMLRAPMSYSVIPVMLLIWCYYLWQRNTKSIALALTDIFIFYYVSLSLAVIVVLPLALVISLPSLLLILQDLANVTSLPLSDRKHTSKRRLSRNAITLLLAASLILGLAVMFANTALSVTSGLVLLFILLMILTAFLRSPLPPVKTVIHLQRQLAGTKESFEIELVNLSRHGGFLQMTTSFPGIEIKQGNIALDSQQKSIRLDSTPPLAGTQEVVLNGCAFDHWGLVQLGFQLPVLQLKVMPRAVYAAKLVKQYLAEAPGGSLRLSTHSGVQKNILGRWQGGEFYGNQQYQPGDSLKNIDWKHSLKYDELINRTFTDFSGQPAILLVNLICADAGEVDRVAYKLLTSALSLAREGIPTVVAAYDNTQVQLLTTKLMSESLLRCTLELVFRIRQSADAIHHSYATSPNLILNDIPRLILSSQPAAHKLGKFLHLKYEFLEKEALKHPVTVALKMITSQRRDIFSIFVVSAHNHDTSALAYNSYRLQKAGNPVIDLTKAALS